MFSDTAPELGKQEYLYLAAIVLLAACLRMIVLSSVPVGFYCDEASYAYDAYCIANLPMFLRAFNDGREATFVYLAAPVFKLLGPSEFSLRITAASIGVLTVIALYFVVAQLTNRRVAVLAALFLAISPWHIQFSRTGFRAILLPLLFCVSLAVFLKGTKKPPYLILAGLLFGLTLHTYASARVLVPLFGAGLALIYWEYLWREKKYSLAGAAVFLAIFVYLALAWISPEGMFCARAAGFVTNPLVIAYQYVNYFNPLNLFVLGDENLRHSPYGLGELHWIEFATVATGIYFLVRNCRSQWAQVLLLWLILYPIPAAVTGEPFHTIRAIVGGPAFAAVSGYGLYQLSQLWRLPRKVFVGLTGVLIAASVGVFIYFYFLQYPKYSAYTWQYGMREAIAYAESSPDDCVLLSTRINEAHIFPLFYGGPMPPSTFGKSPIVNPQGHGSLGKYEIVTPKTSPLPPHACLFILRPEDVVHIEARGVRWGDVKTIHDGTGKPVLRIIRTVARDAAK